QCLADQRPQPALGYALGERVDGGERLLERRAVLAEPPVLGMHHLEAERPAAHLAEAAQTRAAGEVRLLARGGIEEAQGEHPRAVGDAREQLPAAAVGDLGQLDLALDGGARADLERAEWRDARAVLVAQRQEEQQVRDARDAETREALGECRADPA